MPKTLKSELPKTHWNRDYRNIFFDPKSPCDCRPAITQDNAEQILGDASTAAEHMHCAVESVSSLLSVATSPDCASPSDRLVSDVAFAICNLLAMASVLDAISEHAGTVGGKS